jgi:hypothetical protein
MEKFTLETAADLYEDIALTYTRLVRRESGDAATAIEQIQAAFGAQAALRAALIITILKMEVQQNDWIPGIGLYAHLLEDYPDVLPLTTHAMRCCLEVWAGSLIKPGGWAEWAAA